MSTPKQLRDLCFFYQNLAGDYEFTISVSPKHLKRTIFVESTTYYNYRLGYHHGYWVPPGACGISRQVDLRKWKCEDCRYIPNKKVPKADTYVNHV